MRSKIAEEIEFKSHQGVVSLVRHLEHAVILLETQSDAGNYELKKVDFKPRAENEFPNSLYWADYGTCLFKGYQPGFVVNENFYGKDGKSLNEYDRKMIFERLRLKNESFSWLCDTTSIKKVMDLVQEEQLNPPRFVMKSELGDKGAYNCCTWAMERLNMMGIDATCFLKNAYFAYYIRLPECGSHFTEPTHNTNNETAYLAGKDSGSSYYTFQ